MTNDTVIKMAASEQMSNEIVTSNNTNRMQKANTKSAGVSHPATDNRGKNIDKNSKDYLNKKNISVR